MWSCGGLSACVCSVLEDLREKLTGRRSAADVQGVSVHLDEAEVAVPAQLVQDKRQRFALRFGEIRDFEIEYLARGVGGELLAARSRGRRIVGGPHQIGYFQGNE